MGYAGYSIKVTSATVTGMGSVKRIKGRPNYQLFEVKVCGVNFLTGNGVPLGAHFLWHTSRLSAAAAAAYKKLAGQVNALHQLIVPGQASPAQQKQAQELRAKLQAVRAQNASKAAYAEDWDQRNHVQPIFHDGCQ